MVSRNLRTTSFICVIVPSPTPNYPRHSHRLSPAPARSRTRRPYWFPGNHRSVISIHGRKQPLIARWRKMPGVSSPSPLQSPVAAHPRESRRVNVASSPRPSVHCRWLASAQRYSWPPHDSQCGRTPDQVQSPPTGLRHRAAELIIPSLRGDEHAITVIVERAAIPAPVEGRSMPILVFPDPSQSPVPNGRPPGRQWYVRSARIHRNRCRCSPHSHSPF